jgi:hypothetical protein
MAWVCEQTIPTELPPLVGEVSADFYPIEGAKCSTWHFYGRILGFLDRSRYFIFQVASQLYSRGWVDPVSDSIHLKKSDIAGNRTRDIWICRQELWPLDYRGDHVVYSLYLLAMGNWYQHFACIRTQTYMCTQWLKSFSGRGTIAAPLKYKE